MVLIPIVVCIPLVFLTEGRDGIRQLFSSVRSKGSLLTVTLLHGLQNGLVVINRGLGMAESTWLLMGVYVVIAILIVFMDRQMFFAKPAKS